MNTYWPHSQDYIMDDDVTDDAPAVPGVGTGVCPVPERGQPCTYPDGNPRKTLDGSLVCGRHTTLTEKSLTDLPDLWELLGDPTRQSGRDARVTEKRTDAPAPSPDLIDARSQIVQCLNTLERVIHTLTGVAPLDVDKVRTESRRLAAETSEALRGVATEQVLFERVRDGKTRASGEEREKAARRATEARKHADDLRGRWNDLDQRARSGRDVIDARTSRVARYLDRLLNEPGHAVDVVTLVSIAWWKATREAHPLPSGIRVQCPTCGERVRLRTEGDIQCPGQVATDEGPKPCPEHGHAEWWALQLGVDLRTQMTADEVVAWLLENHRIPIEPATLRKWTSRGKVTATTQRRDGRLVTVYSPVEVLDAATSQRPRTGAAS